MKKFAAGLAAAFFLSMAQSPVSAEEGMWTFDNPPVKQLKEIYCFEPSKQWLDHLRLASVRFNDGGSGSFVSPNGLVLTNHHVAVGQLQKMSSENKDYVKDGFYASERTQEVKCTDLELNVLVQMQDVTARVMKAAEKLSGDEAIKARKAEIAKIEQEGLEKTGMRSDVVTLYHGGEYWLYTYKKYRDVRLVMAPEKQAAFFGGSADNFTYPRYDMDYAIFRAYENDKPVKTQHYLKMNPDGVKDGDLVFVSGHPGTTKRQNTYAQYLFNRDYIYPNSLERFDALISALNAYSAKGPEEKRRAATIIFYLENSKKAYGGEYQGLQNENFTKEFKAREDSLRRAVASNPEVKKEVGSAWEDVEKAMKLYGDKYAEGSFGFLRGQRLPSIAMNIVLYVTETAKPDAERLDGFHDSQLDEWRFINLSPEPIYKDLEEAVLAANLELSLKKLGDGNKNVRTLLGGKAPQQRAKELIENSRLSDVNYRKELLDGKMDALKKSDDPLIRLALELEPSFQEYYKWQEKELESLVTPAKEKIAAASFKIYGKEMYPDATFTLRLSYGTVKGYEMNGTFAPPFTTFYGLYDRHYGFEGRDDWWLPESFLTRKNKLNLSSYVNFVSSNDVVGGNSGSPVVNRNGELVGLVFDGNIESLVGRFLYDGNNNRTVSVHTAAIIESLRNIYDAEGLTKELLNGK